jgi:coenzyme Q-binding protein COQ10
MPSRAEQRLLRHQPAELFDLVADIESYPQFLPWCRAARITKRDGATVTADLVIGFKMFRETFTSVVTFAHPERIDVTYVRGPLRHLTNRWQFAPDPKGCLVDFYVDFAFRSRLLEGLIGTVFGEAVSRMVGAFEVRADALYGARRPKPLKPQPDRA